MISTDYWRRITEKTRVPEEQITKQIIQQRARQRLSQVLPWVILCAGLLLSWLTSQEVRQRALTTHQAEFKFRSDELVAALEQHLISNVQLLRGVAGLYAASKEVHRAEFAAYAEALTLAERFRGIQGIGFAAYVPAQNLRQHEAAVRRQGFADYRVTPDGSRQEYSAIVRLEPFDWRNRRAFGYDMFSEPVRHQAMAQARDQAAPALSAKVRLLQETDLDVQAGFLIYMPVYRQGASIQTVAERRNALIGWAYSPIRMNDLMSSFLASEFPTLAKRAVITVFDGESMTAEGRMFGSGPLEGKTPSAVQTNFQAAYQSTNKIKLYGHIWTVQLQSLPSFDATGSKDDKSDTLLVAGVIISLLLAFIMHAQNRTRLRQALALNDTAAANQALSERENLLRLIYDTSSVAIFLVDNNGCITHANRRMEEMFCCPAERLIGSEYVSHIHPDDRETGRQRMLQLLQQSVFSVDLERHYWRDDGTEFWGHLTGQALRDSQQNAVGLVGVIADISDRKAGEAAMRLAQIVFNSSPEGILVTDAENRIISVNPAFSKITGYRLDEVKGKNPKLLGAGRQTGDFYRDIWLALESVGHWEGELWNQRKDGSQYPELLSISRVNGTDGLVTNYVAIFQDITARRNADARIRHLAHHDYLTGLPNRAFFVERVAQAMSLAHRYGRKMALLFIDLDNFKPINDRHGHDAGDAVLCEVAERLRQNTRESDTLCRQGGDEFIVLIPEIRDTDSIEELAHKLRLEIEAPCHFGDLEFVVSASIGIALYPDHGESVDALIQSADSAMYRAKAAGSNCISIASVSA